MLFVISLVLIGLAYWQLDLNGMVLMFDAEFQRATVLMLVGSLLFFFSLSGFAIAVLTRLRGVYLKRLRPFTTRQVVSKFNTSFVSIWVVCVCSSSPSPPLPRAWPSLTPLPATSTRPIPMM